MSEIFDRNIKNFDRKFYRGSFSPKLSPPKLFMIDVSNFFVFFSSFFFFFLFLSLFLSFCYPSPISQIFRCKVSELSSIICNYLAHFQTQARKMKNPSWKFFFIFQAMELSSSGFKRFLIFSYISGNGNPAKLFIFKETETLEGFLYFGKYNF